MSEYIVVTGGAGYIGSHTVIELIQNNYNVIIIDNLSNSCYDSIARIEFIVGKKIIFYKIDLRTDYNELSMIFDKYSIKSVIHFAALKAVGESTKIPLIYYENNIIGTINLLKIMNKFNVKSIVFSSSATVYGDVTRFKNSNNINIGESMIPIPENCPKNPTNPYGKSKFFIEQIIYDLYKSDDDQSWKVAILRYFNPIGAHSSGLIGEDPLGIPNNLLPYLAQVAIGRRKILRVFGNDYDSHDGTPIRDYIHVIDLAKGHISALNYLNNNNKGLFREWNLGTGKGSTVFEVFNSFCKVINKSLPYEIVDRRNGDVLNLTADPKRANKELNWEAKLSIIDACKDLWKWTLGNPFGFKINNYKWENFNDDTRLHHVDINGFKVSIMNYGATIQNIQINNDSLILKFNDLNFYKSINENPYFGSTIGRYANRIYGSKFKFNDKIFKLNSNENNINTLHGGSKGFDKQEWLGPIVKTIDNDDGGVMLQFKLIDYNGSNGFPNNLETIVTFKIKSNKILEIEYEAKSDGITPINLTNHTYFNLGITEPNINDLEINLNFKNYLKKSTENENILNDEIHEIDQNSFKLNDEKFDNCFISTINEPDSIDTRSFPLQEIFSAKSSNHSLQIQSTEPSFQFYTGDFINVDKFHQRYGFAIEPGRFINAINQPKWQNQVLLNKDQVYGSKTIYIFE